MQNTIYRLIAFLFVVAPTIIQGQDFETRLKEQIPNATVLRLEANGTFSEVFEIHLKQPLDHQDTSKGYFFQRLFLSHRDAEAPMLFVTEGYAAQNSTYELVDMLQSNQLIVEYRFFGTSAPEKLNWKYLSNDLAIQDLHRIRTIFGEIYQGDWVSTGISKGGTTTLIYKSKYPDDVIAAIPYVAPLALAQEDNRTEKHLKKVGDKACRKKLLTFQKAALQNRDALLPLIKKNANKKRMSYSLKWDEVLEYAVLELPFSFWQWGGECEEIPDENVSTDSMFNYIQEIVDWSFYSDATCNYFKPAFYQFMTELGYYGYSLKQLDGLIITLAAAPNNQLFAPQNTGVEFYPYLQEVIDFLDKRGDRIIYIYGEYDPWTACGYKPKKQRDAIRMVKKEGSHSTRIANLSAEQQEEIRAKLREWLQG